MGVDVFALRDISNNFADVFAVLHSRITCFEIGQSDFVANWHIVLRGQTERRVVVSDAAQHIRTCGQAFNDDNANVVCLLVNEQVRDFIWGGVGHFLPRLGFENDLGRRRKPRPDVGEGASAFGERSRFHPVERT